MKKIITVIILMLGIIFNPTTSVAQNQELNSYCYGTNMFRLQYLNEDQPPICVKANASLFKIIYNWEENLLCITDVIKVIPESTTYEFVQYYKMINSLGLDSYVIRDGANFYLVHKDSVINNDMLNKRNDEVINLLEYSAKLKMLAMKMRELRQTNEEGCVDFVVSNFEDMQKYHIPFTLTQLTLLSRDVDADFANLGKKFLDVFDSSTITDPILLCIWMESASMLVCDLINLEPLAKPIKKD